MEALISTVEDREWIPVEDASAPGRVRRAATQAAARLGFSEARAGEVAIAVSEVATNAFRHAHSGKALLRIVRQAELAALEVVVMDSGPGIADVAAVSEDGVSTAGTLGLGIGAAQRLSSSYQSHSVVGRGTVTVLRFWPAQAVEALKNSGVSGITRPIDGEEQCGDAWAYAERGGRTLLMLADGLGHGELAAIASRAAVAAFETSRATSPAAILKETNTALRSTRGAAAAVVAFDRSAKLLTFSGVGNIAVWIEHEDERKALVSAAGIVGAYSRPMRDFEMALPEHALIVMHSDGLTSKWTLQGYPGIRVQEPALIAATLLRDAGVHHDDAGVLVARAS